MLRCGLKSLEELDATKEAERLSMVFIEPLARNKDSNNPSEPSSCGIMDLIIIEAFSTDFNPSDPL